MSLVDEARITDQDMNPHLHEWLTLTHEDADSDSVVFVPVGALSVADSPRIAGENPEHIQSLAVADGELPPLIVHHETMRVIDGVHRLRAAELRGEERIKVRLFYGDDMDAFVLAVKANIAHGLPLTLADRRAAAVRIILSHQQWSDRMIASVTGLAARTIAEIRRRTPWNSRQEEARIGQDGRVRPINGAAGRELAAKLITENPSLSLRQIGQTAGISPETARDVRKRLQLGEDPVLGQRQKENKGNPGRLRKQRAELGLRAGNTRGSTEASSVAVQRLRMDPALRFTETGRILLRLLHMNIVETGDWRKISENVPVHCSGIIANLARECAEAWLDLAEQLDRKVADIP
jgi:ParB-like chromosome segregation protein Spo0J